MENFFTNAQIHGNRMMRFFALFLLFPIVFSCQPISAQMTYSTKNKKAIKYFDQAMNYPQQHLTKMMRPDYQGGINLLDKSLEQDANFWEAYMVKAEFSEYNGQFDAAIDAYKKALAINPAPTPTGSTYFFLGNLLFNTGRYKEAQQSIQTFFKFNERQIANRKLYNEAQNLMQSIDLSLKLMAHSYPFDPINLGQGVNTKDPEYFPTITVDGKTLLFTRRIVDKRVPIRSNDIEDLKQRQEDFFVSTKDDEGIFQTAISMPENINTVNNEGAPTLGPDGRTLVFVACPDASGTDYGSGREGYGSCDFFLTKKLGERWTNPVNLPGRVNTSAWESQPSLSSDGKTMYFIRGIRTDGGMLNTDIYVTHLQDDGNWGVAKRLPDNINTPKSEESVLIHPDGKTLYFASRGHAGLGGSDLFMTKLQEDGNWSDPVNLGYPINTNADENSLLVSADGEIAYFASNRKGGYGELDIYSFVMPEHLRPTRTTYFAGRVYDINNNMSLPGRFHLYDLKTGKEVIRSQADPVTGEFLVTLPENASYALSVEMDGYLNFSKNFDLILRKDEDAYHMNIPMVPLTASQSVVLENIFFDLNKANLLPESKTELEKLYDFLQKNPTIKIEISGHTDSRGSKELNQDLSQRRAQSVVDYLIAKGISTSRLVAKGYGSTQPKITDAAIEKLSTEAEKEAAHQQNRRTEYKIIE